MIAIGLCKYYKGVNAAAASKLESKALEALVCSSDRARAEKDREEKVCGIGRVAFSK